MMFCKGITTCVSMPRLGMPMSFDTTPKFPEWDLAKPLPQLRAQGSCKERGRPGRGVLLALGEQ
eukprot:4050369-Lingulodinium_polyedra.AAC.1